MFDCVTPDKGIIERSANQGNSLFFEIIGVMDFFLLNFFPKKLFCFIRSQIDIIKRIEHFGSTAIPNIPSKPIIDLLVEVSSLDETKKKVVPILEAAEGYEYVWRPTIGMKPPWYAWFIKRDDTGKRTPHIHMIEKDFKMWERLLFRDYLRELPDYANKYGELKEKLSREYPNDRQKYTFPTGQP